MHDDHQDIEEEDVIMLHYCIFNVIVWLWC